MAAALPLLATVDAGWRQRDCSHAAGKAARRCSGLWRERPGDRVMKQNEGRKLLHGLTFIATAFFAGAPAAETPVERGRYLVESIMACGNCHTPKDASGAPIAERNMAGGGLSFSLPPFSGTASNITPDRETGIGSWSEAEIKRAIVEGERPNHGRLQNTPLASVMATPFFKALLPRDLDAVVAYLRSLKPLRNEIPPPVYRMPVRHDKYPDTEAGFTESMMADPVRRGAYLVTIGHCMECHSPREKGVSDYSRLGAGGRVFDASLVQGLPSSWPGAKAPNITSHPTKGLGSWSNGEIKRAITQGISRDGRRLQPPMGFGYYARMTEADLNSIVAYLRTVPPAD
jgi:mono/diheme cytochrome c family protein